MSERQPTSPAIYWATFFFWSLASPTCTFNGSSRSELRYLHPTLHPTFYQRQKYGTKKKETKMIPP